VTSVIGSQPVSPMTAGLGIQAAVNVSSLPPGSAT
jgi:hypothetical protein